MFGIPMLDVLIGLVFVYLLLALVCTSINEMIAGWRDSREKHLRIGICNLLGEHDGPDRRRTPVPFHDPLTGADTGTTMVKTFYAHPMIRALHEDGTRPSYIPAPTFSQVILDLFSPSDGTTPRSIPAFVSGINNALAVNGDLRRTLLVLSGDAADISQLRTALEAWFNSTMDRVSAWYKNTSQKMVLFISLGVCIVINADSIQLVKDLYQNPTQRSAIVAQAEQMVRNAANTPSSPAAPAIAAAGTSLTKEEADKLADTIGKLNKTGFSWGWGKGYYFSVLQWNWENFIEAVLKMIGILLTAVAASLGAPFWFDTLNKLVTIRSVGKSPNETPSAQQPAAPPSAAGPAAVQPSGQTQSVG
jgi:hypothetical protein